MLPYENDTSKLAAREAATVVKANRIEPYLRAIGVTFEVDVGRLVPVAREEETAIRTDAKNGGHGELYCAAVLGRNMEPCCHITQ
jgi:hypothetical protein